MSLHQAALSNLEEQKSLCIVRIEQLKEKLSAAEERLAQLEASIRRIRSANE